MAYTSRPTDRAESGTDVTLLCDWPDCREQWVSPTTQGINPVRKSGKHGWLYKGGKDYCLRHRTEARKTRVADLPPQRNARAAE